MANDAARGRDPRNRRLVWTRRGAYAGLLLESVWPLVLGLGCLLAIFLTLAWFGLFNALGDWSRFAVLALLAAGVLAVVWRARGLRLPQPGQVDARIERESRLDHQPLRAQSEEPTGDDPFARALWREHQRRMALQLANLSGGVPNTRTERLDPFALRAALALLLVTAFAFSFGPNGGRMSDAFAPAEAAQAVAARIDAWVTPPGYTGRAPIFLSSAASAGATAVEAPEGSVLSVRISDGSDAVLNFVPADGSPPVQITPGGDASQDGGAANPAEAAAPGASAETSSPTKTAAATSPAASPETGTAPVAGEYEFPLAVSGEARLEQGLRTLGNWAFTVTPDTDPEIRFEGEPTQARNGALELAYVVADDYGVRSGRAELQVTEDVAPGARALVAAPQINLALPRRTKGEAKGRTSTDLTESPYAGAMVTMHLAAEDDAKQVGRSEAKTFRLPERQFSNPLARAVIEQRRMLALDANAAGRVVDMLDAVTLRGEDFIENPADYLALRAVRSRIAGSFSDETLLSAVDFMWEIALGIEDGNLSLAERRLRDAREQLSEALENGASDEEIERLMAELRAAMQDYMQALAEAMRNMPPMSQDQMQMGDMQEIRPQDLDRMLDQIEDLAKSGSKDAAQQLLSELQNMLDNLQAMRPGQQQSGEQNAMQQQMNKLGEMLQRQQQLMDETFNLGREQMRRRQGEMGEPGEQQEQQQGQQGEQGQEGQQGQGEPMTAEQLQQMLEQLQAQQGQLQEDLEQLQQELEGMGMQPGEGFGEAGEAMGKAEGALGEGDDGQALDQQGRAMEALRRGAQDMMQQMQQAMQNGPGQQGQPGQPGQQGQQGQPGQLGQGYGRGQQRSGRDPLGRPQASEGPDFGDEVAVPDEIDTQRARQILDAIRNRLGNALSPQLEREYLERLLQTQ